LKRKLPKGWARIGRPETKRSPERAEIEEIMAGEHRKKDKAGRWLYFTTPIWGVEEGLGARFSPIIRQAIRRNRSGKATVLDLGCGAGSALQDLKRQFGGSVKTVGQVLERTPGEKYGGVDRLIEGEITKIVPRESFDLIYSYSGSVRGTRLKQSTVEKVVGWLRPGGTAVIDIGLLGIIGEAEIDEIKTTLKVNGIKRWRFTKKGALAFRKPATGLPW